MERRKREKSWQQVAEQSLFKTNSSYIADKKIIKFPYIIYLLRESGRIDSINHSFNMHK